MYSIRIIRRFKILSIFQVRHEYVECEMSKRMACLRYLIRKEAEDWILNEKSKSSTTTEASVTDTMRTPPPLFQALVFIDKSSDLQDACVASELGLSQAMAAMPHQNESMISATVQSLLVSMNLDERAEALDSVR